ncbi:hypothetical protein [Sporosarcina obsidiansis]|uniref:hypothetical protein n=1 Tax=Sporosarcina obsidiansis TaxID=2660748 RepID=UPI00129AEDC8|nr:hypothetical protein [Sporosarcina obsidiansis]
MSHFQNMGGINENYFQTFNKEQVLAVCKQAITTAVKQPSADNMPDSDYDLAVRYVSNKGELPTHGIHLWIGEQVKSM